jgi:hypothetical protein
MSVIGLILPLLGFMPMLWNSKHVICDSMFFKINQATVIILILASVYVTAMDYFGDKIHCDSTIIPTDIMNSYCWNQPIFYLLSKQLLFIQL